MFVLIRHLPAESALAGAMRAGRPNWTLEAHLLDDLRISMTGSKERPSKPHPMRPKSGGQRKQSPERARKIAAARKRARERRRKIAAGEL